MGELETYFFDTYALYEIIHGSKNYEKYKSEITIITTKLNLMELHYTILRLYGKDKADEAFENFKIYCIEINDAIIKEANELKLKYKDRRLSYVDCIGYILAKSRNIKFLTGDRGFEDLDNVEYVK